MAQKSFPIAAVAVLGVFVLAAGTWVALGVRAALGVSKDNDALEAVGASEPKALHEVRASEEARLEKSPVPIENAMQTLAARGRLGVDAGLTPQPSNDRGPLEGWAFRQHEVPAWMLVTRSAAPAAPTSDGGAAPPPVTAPDAGSSK